MVVVLLAVKRPYLILSFKQDNLRSLQLTIGFTLNDEL